MGSEKSNIPSNEKRGLLPAYEQIDLFKSTAVSWPVKDDLASMEIPLFSLSKQADTATREYRRGPKVIRIIPSSVGAATMFDKDLLIYVASQITEALNTEQPIAKTIQVDAFDFLTKTERGDSGGAYEAILPMLRRLRGTTIETNIPTGNVVQTEGFSLIDNYKVLSEKTRKDKKTGKDIVRVLSFTVTISDWLWNGLLQYEVATISPKYWGLSKPIERRLYEVGRKHCNDKAMWKINIDLLMEKIGVSRERFKFRDDLRKIIETGRMPDYELALDINTTPDEVWFLTRDVRKLHKHIIDNNLYDWFKTLQRRPEQTTK